MQALDPGVVAPFFTLPGRTGKTYSNRDRTWDRLLLVFFKVSCPTCQFTFPYIERLHRNYPPSAKFQIWGISQDNLADTRAFAAEYGLTFPLLLDSPDYAVSTQYQLTHVPTAFLISGEGMIRHTSVGFFKNDWLYFSREMAERLGVEERPVFLPGESIPDRQFG